MSDTDVARMEHSLVALAGQERAMREALFARFLAAYPDRAPLFLNQHVTSIRMTDETLQWMLGLAGGAKWVWGQVAELVYQHRNYGALTAEEYAAFVAMTVDALRDAIGGWDATTDAAWRRAAGLLETMIERAMREWAASPLPYP